MHTQFKKRLAEQLNEPCIPSAKLSGHPGPIRSGYGPAGDRLPPQQQTEPTRPPFDPAPAHPRPANPTQLPLTTMSDHRRRPRLICYDIACPRRLQRIHRCVSQIALSLQYSIYYADLTPKALARLISELDQQIDAREDDIRLYTLPTPPQAIALGRSTLPVGVHLLGNPNLGALITP